MNNLIEDIQFMLAHREHPERIATRLNTTPTALARRLNRHGHHQLAQPFEQTAKANRKKAAA